MFPIKVGFCDILLFIYNCFQCNHNYLSFVTLVGTITEADNTNGITYFLKIYLLISIMNHIGICYELYILLFI